MCRNMWKPLSGRILDNNTTSSNKHSSNVPHFQDYRVSNFEFKFVIVCNTVLSAFHIMFIVTRRTIYLINYHSAIKNI